MIHQKFLRRVGLLVTIFCLPLSAQSGKIEPFEDALRESVKQYRAGKIAEASAALEQAKAIIEKAKSVQMGNALPDPPTGWEADEMKTEDVGPLLGGGKVVKKLYKNKTGQQQVQLEVFYGSSLIRLMRGMLANEAIAKAQGYDTKRAGGESVLVKKVDAKNFEINMPMEDEIMVRMTGREGAEEDLMLKLMRDVDRREIKSLVKP
jgi:hypothetical protein